MLPPQLMLRSPATAAAAAATAAAAAAAAAAAETPLLLCVDNERDGDDGRFGDCACGASVAILGPLVAGGHRFNY